MGRGFYSSSGSEDNDTEEDSSDETNPTEVTEEDPSIQKLNAISSLENTEIIIDKHTKYKVLRASHKDNKEKTDEVFDWYKADSNTTYFCLTLRNY